MIRFSKKILLIIITILLFIGGVVFARNQKEIKLFVGPTVFNIELEKGETYNGRILLWNKNDFKLTVNSQLINFNAKDELGGINYEKKKGAEWFLNKESSFVLKPKERKIIKFQIKISDETPRGGYYVSWIFTPQLEESKANAKLVPRVSSLFLISVGKKEKPNFKIIETEIPIGARYSFLEKIFKKEIILNNGSFPFIFRIKNDDVYHIRPQGTLTVFKGKKSIGNISIAETTILPKKIRKTSVDFKPSSGFLSNFYFGEYKIVLNLRESGSLQKIEKEVFILPWKGVLLIKILLISTLLYFIIVKYRNNQKITKNKIKNSKTRKTKRKTKKSFPRKILKKERIRTKSTKRKVARKIIDTKKRKR